MLARLVVKEDRLHAEIVLRSTFRKRSISAHEVALVLLILDKVWSHYERLERPTAQQTSPNAAISEARS